MRTGTFWTLLADCTTPLCVDICMSVWWEPSMSVCLFVTSSHFLCVAHLDASCMFMMCPYIYAMWALHRRVFLCVCEAEGEVAAGCLASVCSPVIRPDLRLTRAHQEQCPVPHFLCSQWWWDLFTIFTQGIMMFDLTLFWVCLCKGYFRPLLPLREKTGCVHRKNKPQIIVYGWCEVCVFLCLAFGMKSCCVALLVAWLTLVFLPYCVSLRCSWPTQVWGCCIWDSQHRKGVVAWTS